MFVRDQQLDALSVRGSYAGAFGIPQFMPGSWRRWGIDFDGDGRADLRASHADAIGSVANFLASHGWERDAPIAFDAQLQGEGWRTLIDGTVNAVGLVVRCWSAVLRRLQTGSVRAYAMSLFLGVVVIVGYYLSAWVR